MAQKNLVNEMFIASGRPEQGDNRSYYVKTLNKILADGIFKVEICEEGSVWTNPKYLDAKGDKIKFNVEIKAYGWKRRAYLNRYIDAESLLKEVGKFIKNPEIAKQHTASMQVHGLNCVECDRCHGQGFIEAFSHVCQGICFECYGSKYVVRKYTVTI